jgi:hypothetical protein
VTVLSVLQRIAPTCAADSLVADWIAASVGQHRADGWGNAYFDAMAYHVAHCWTMSKREQQSIAQGTYGAAAGAVTALRAGDLGVNFASRSASRGQGISPQDEEYLSTSYGVRYLSLRDTREWSGPRIISVDAA